MTHFVLQNFIFTAVVSTTARVPPVTPRFPQLKHGNVLKGSDIQLHHQIWRLLWYYGIPSTRLYEHITSSLDSQLRASETESQFPSFFHAVFHTSFLVGYWVFLRLFSQNGRNSTILGNNVVRFFINALLCFNFHTCYSAVTYPIYTRDF